jgi:hypothetical protein
MGRHYLENHLASFELARWMPLVKGTVIIHISIFCESVLQGILPWSLARKLGGKSFSHRGVSFLPTGFLGYLQIEIRKSEACLNLPFAVVLCAE